MENAHEAIIPKDIFLLVQEEISRRSHVHESPSGKKRLFSSSHVLAQKVYCAECGDLYRRIHWYTRGKKSTVWRCISRLENAGVVCHSHIIYEEDLKQAAQTSLAKQKETKKKIQTAIRFLQKQQPEITDFDEALVGRLIERITIEEGRIKVLFKSGMEIEE